MLASSLLILGGLLFLVLGAEGLIRGASALALRLGVTPLVVGLTVVAFGTSSPELFVCVRAAISGKAGIALASVVGSNIWNATLVLGVAALVRPLRVHAQLVRREVPLMIGATLVLCALLLDGTLSRWDGLLLLIGAVGYTVFSYRSARRCDDPAVLEEFDEAMPGRRDSAARAALFVAAGLAALVFGANLLVRGAVAVAGGLGVSEVVIGLTLVAAGTSLPELATSAAAAFRDEPDMAIGNAIGSNVFNILAVLGLAALIHPLHVEGVRLLDLGVLVGTALLVLPVMARGLVLNRWEGGALIAGYLAYVVSLFR
jgi:cation:H+ antiporter